MPRASRRQAATVEQPKLCRRVNWPSRVQNDLMGPDTFTQPDKGLAVENWRAPEPPSCQLRAVIQDDIRTWPPTGNLMVAPAGIEERTLKKCLDGCPLVAASMLELAIGRRYGLVGSDPAAVAALLRVPAGDEADIPDNLDVLLVDEAVDGTPQSVVEVVLGDLAAAAADPPAIERASTILQGLGFTFAQEQQHTLTLSFEWRMRVALARGLFLQPSVLLLNEPTQHLTLRATLWLEQYLQRYTQTVVVVSSDRSFLRAATTDLICVHADSRVHVVPGGVSDIEANYWPNIIKKYRSRRTEQLLGTADKPFSPVRPQDLRIALTMLQLCNADFQHTPGSAFSLRGLDLSICLRMRVALFGPHGSGKSMVMDLLAGKLRPMQGRRDAPFHRTLGVGHYAQRTLDAMVTTASPIEYLMLRCDERNCPQSCIRSELDRFGLRACHHQQPIHQLSSSQKAAVVFASFVVGRYDILLLDEPTQHLDMRSIEHLAQFLQRTDAAVIISSNNVELLSRVCNKTIYSQIWTLEDGNLTRFQGFFDEFKQNMVEAAAPGVGFKEPAVCMHARG